MGGESSKEKSLMESAEGNFSGLQLIASTNHLCFGETRIMRSNVIDPIAVKCRIFSNQHDFNGYLKAAEKRRKRFTIPAIAKLLYIRTELNETLCSNVFSVETFYEYSSETLETRLSQRKYSKMDQCFREDEIYFFLDCILSALICMHFDNVVHGDIRPSTILISPTGHFQLSDINFLYGSQPTPFSLTLMGEPQKMYLSPERIIALCHKDISRLKIDQSTIETQKCDVFSIGLTVLEMASLREISAELYDYDRVEFKYSNLLELLSLVKFKYSKNLFELVSAMLDLNPSTRPDFFTLAKLLENHHQLSSARFLSNINSITSIENHINISKERSCKELSQLSKAIQQSSNGFISNTSVSHSPRLICSTPSRQLTPNKAIITKFKVNSHSPQQGKLQLIIEADIKSNSCLKNQYSIENSEATSFKNNEGVNLTSNSQKQNKMPQILSINGKIKGLLRGHPKNYEENSIKSDSSFSSGTSIHAQKIKGGYESSGRQVELKDSDKEQFARSNDETENQNIRIEKVIPQSSSKENLDSFRMYKPQFHQNVILSDFQDLDEQVNSTVQQSKSINSIFKQQKKSSEEIKREQPIQNDVETKTNISRNQRTPFSERYKGVEQSKTPKSRKNLQIQTSPSNSNISVKSQLTQKSEKTPPTYFIWKDEKRKLTTEASKSPLGSRPQMRKFEKSFLSNKSDNDQNESNSTNKSSTRYFTNQQTVFESKLNERNNEKDFFNKNKNSSPKHEGSFISNRSEFPQASFISNLTDESQNIFPSIPIKAIHYTQDQIQGQNDNQNRNKIESTHKKYILSPQEMNKCLDQKKIFNENNSKADAALYELYLREYQVMMRRTTEGFTEPQ